MPVKAVSSKLLAQRWDEDAYKQHMDRMRNASSTLDMTAPKKYPHLVISLKKLLIEEERQTRYHNENKVLMDKIREIVKGRGTLDRWNDHETKSLNRPYMAKMRKRIHKENVLALRRLRGVMSTMTHAQWEGDFKRHLHYKDMLRRTTKDYQFRRPSLSRAVKTSDEKSVADSTSPAGRSESTYTPISPEQRHQSRTDSRDRDDNDNGVSATAAAAGTKPNAAAAGTKPNATAAGPKPNAAVAGTAPAAATAGTKPKAAAAGTKPDADAVGIKPNAAAAVTKPDAAAAGAAPAGAAAGTKPDADAVGTKPNAAAAVTKPDAAAAGAAPAAATAGTKPNAAAADTKSDDAAAGAVSDATSANTTPNVAAAGTSPAAATAGTVRVAAAAGTATDDSSADTKLNAAAAGVAKAASTLSAATDTAAAGTSPNAATTGAAPDVSATRHVAARPPKSRGSVKGFRATEPIYASQRLREDRGHEPTTRAVPAETHATITDPAARSAHRRKQAQAEQSRKKGQRRAAAATGTSSTEGALTAQNDSEDVSWLRRRVPQARTVDAHDGSHEPQRRAKREPTSGDGFLPPIADKGGLVSQKSDVVP